MDLDQEAKAIADVTAKLQSRFSDVDPVLVEAAVRVSHSQLTGPIREFVPLLVEHAARERLALACDLTPDDLRTTSRRDAHHRSRPVASPPRSAVKGSHGRAAAR